MSAVDADLAEMAAALRRPTNVIEALAAVAGELPGIGKDSQASQQQGGYSYRGIEAITREAGPLFAKYGVVFAPSVTQIEITNLTVNGKPWTDTRLSVAYKVYGPGGRDDCIELGPIVGIGRDNSDKGANKALTQAFKYVLLQVLCIADRKDDADGQTHEADPEAVQQHTTRVLALRDRVKELDLAQQVKELNLGWPWSAVACAQIEDLIDAFTSADEPTEPAQPGLL